MRDSLPGGRSVRVLAGLAAVLSLQALLAQDAKAQNGVDGAPVASLRSTAPRAPATGAPRTRVSATAPGQYAPGKRFFVEFRARHANTYGHLYVMYGEVNERHEIIRSQIAGLIPSGDKQNCLDCSASYWTLGHVVPVPSEIGPSDGDLEEQFVDARFRVWIDGAQYKRLVEYINQRKANKLPWHAFLNNCVTFGRDVAAFLNLKVPLVLMTPSIVVFPDALVKMLREENGVHYEQGPLKDAPGPLLVDIAPTAQHEAAKPVAGRTAPTAAAQATGGGVLSSALH